LKGQNYTKSVVIAQLDIKRPTTAECVSGSHPPVNIA
jgi:hypothetical protein